MFPFFRLRFQETLEAEIDWRMSIKSLDIFSILSQFAFSYKIKNAFSFSFPIGELIFIKNSSVMAYLNAFCLLTRTGTSWIVTKPFVSIDTSRHSWSERPKRWSTEIYLIFLRIGKTLELEHLITLKKKNKKTT